MRRGATEDVVGERGYRRGGVKRREQEGASGEAQAVCACVCDASEERGVCGVGSRAGAASVVCVRE